MKFISHMTKSQENPSPVTCTERNLKWSSSGKRKVMANHIWIRKKEVKNAESGKYVGKYKR